MHALEEIWRVLMANGQLLDMRPISKERPLDVMTNQGVKKAGVVDVSGRIPNDEAADNALSSVLKRGMFLNSRKHRFDHGYYWDTIEQMESYIEERWGNFAVLPEAVIENAKRIAVQHGGEPLRFRVRARMQLVRYRKRIKAS